jgi:arginyl-tRNA synthetase
MGHSLQSSTPSTNYLLVHNAEREKQFLALRDQIRSKHNKAADITVNPWRDLEKHIRVLITDKLAQDCSEVNIKTLHRKDFDADVAITVPSILKVTGPGEYIKNCVPVILKAFEESLPTSSYFESATAKGMYVNVKLSKSFLIQSLEALSNESASFVLNRSELGKNVLIDYSSPNAAKALHAGHIRSTIVGQVLGNIHEACGSVVYRLNHINDLGGFGFLIEGWKRCANTQIDALPEGEKVVKVYQIRRTLERICKDAASWSAATQEERELGSIFLGPVSDFAEASERYAEYVTASEATMKRLEAGGQEEVQAWEKIVSISVKDFANFYDKLNIHIDFDIGESFYLYTGKSLIEHGLANGTALRYTEPEFEKDKAIFDELHAKGDLSDAEHADLLDGARRDIGAIVVRLSGNRRVVILRSDGQSIYATRDLGAIQKRYEMFQPQHCIYVVGQEQRIHFKDVFEAASLMHLSGNSDARFEHVYFGFYVDAKTKKKLSSRDGASSVTQLLDDARSYFEQKLKESITAPEERHKTSKELAIASIVFNDLEKDIKGAVEIDASAPMKTIEKFEKAGGAYVVYTACRTNALLNRFAESSGAPALSEELSPTEAFLALQLLRTPDIVAQAASSSNPSVFVKHLLEISSQYSSFYAASPVFRHEGVFLDRVTITRAVNRALKDGLAICNVECPARI